MIGERGRDCGRACFVWSLLSCQSTLVEVNDRGFSAPQELSLGYGAALPWICSLVFDLVFYIVYLHGYLAHGDGVEDLYDDAFTRHG